MSPSTLAGLPTGRVTEVDGILQMTSWLGRRIDASEDRWMSAACRSGPPTSPQHGPSSASDAGALHDAIDVERRRRGWTWRRLADELSVREPVTASMLTRLAAGGRWRLALALVIVDRLDDAVEPFTRTIDGP